MRFFLATFAASTILASPVWALDLQASSKIEAVTVFPRGAEITRTARISVPAGSHEIIIDDLPEGVDPTSVRVEGLADATLQLGSVDVRSELIIVKGSQSRAQKLRNQIERVQREVQRLGREKADLEVRRNLVTTLARGAFSGGEANTATVASDVSLILETATSQLQAITDRQFEIEAGQARLRRQLAALERQIAELVPVQERKTVVSLSVNADSETKSAFQIRYAMENAAWHAAYDADLALGDTPQEVSMSVTRRAQVRQQTGETWDDVALTLSTARPRLASAPPEVSPWILDFARPVAPSSPRSQIQRKKRMLESELTSQSDQRSGMALDAAPVTEQVPVMQTNGFEATYRIAGTVDVSNSGELKSVAIGSETIKPELSVRLVPEMDATAYLLANFTLESETPWLPGEVFLTRNGNHVGRGNLPLLAPGETHSLGFGVDDLIRVEYNETDREKGESGILTASLTDIRRFKTKVTNLHSFDMPVQIIHRMPVSNHEDIKVRMLEKIMKPSTTKHDDKRGVLAWDLTLKAGEKLEHHFGYEVSWPSGMQVSGVN